MVPKPLGCLPGLSKHFIRGLAHSKHSVNVSRYCYLTIFSFQIPIDNMTNEMEQRVEPHNDYFSTQFLLNFAILGTHNITVESSVKDANGIVWKTGPRTTIFVKSLEDPYSQQIRLQQQQAQQPLQQQQQRNAYSRF